MGDRKTRTLPAEPRSGLLLGHTDARNLRIGEDGPGGMVQRSYFGSSQ